MIRTQLVSISRRGAVIVFIAGAFISCLAPLSIAHPLGNFSINHFSRIEVSGDRVRVRYVLDMAEIPAFQEMQSLGTDALGSLSHEELAAFSERVTSQFADAIVLSVDGTRVPLIVAAKSVSSPSGSGGLPTLRIECELEGALQSGSSNNVRQVRFEDTNYSDRIGWREISVLLSAGIVVFDSSAFGNQATDELKAYPEDMLAAPLNERSVEFSFREGEAPAGARSLLSRDGRPVAAQSRDRLAELISVRDLTPGIALFGLLLAVLLGGLHALSPGHGKTVVGAYLVGTRGTARHAAFLGLTVTITHTAGVFALGVITLVASNYVVPERIFPILSFVSGALVAGIGLSLLIRRVRAARAITTESDSDAGGGQSHSHSSDVQVHTGHNHSHFSEGHVHAHHDSSHFGEGHSHPHHSHSHSIEGHHHSSGHDHSPESGHEQDHGHSHDSSLLHSHGGRMHSHLPPGADGSAVGWRSLLALGISGGILPCPSALVVLLAAISLHRVGYGLLLVVAFSIGLASVLTGVGLIFVYAKRFFKAGGRLGRAARVLPILSALVITCAGAAICYEALGQGGFDLVAFLSRSASQLGHLISGGQPTLASAGAIGILLLGLVFGLKHATEVDHIVALSTIISEHRKLSSTMVVGGLWGIGHTLSLIIVGAIVLALRITIPPGTANWLEFGVALMIITLGVLAVRKALRRRSDIHVHPHGHEQVAHAHLHFHDAPAQPHSHTISRIGLKPVIVGAMHGLAGSAALTLLVLTQIESALLGLVYLGVFGIGSILGMLLMSGLVGLPFVLSARKLTGIHFGLQAIAGVLSISFGIWYAFETGIAGRLIQLLG